MNAGSRPWTASSNSYSKMNEYTAHRRVIKKSFSLPFMPAVVAAGSHSLSYESRRSWRTAQANWHPVNEMRENRHSHTRSIHTYIMLLKTVRWTDRKEESGTRGADYETICVFVHTTVENVLLSKTTLSDSLWKKRIIILNGYILAFIHVQLSLTQHTRVWH